MTSLRRNNQEGSDPEVGKLLEVSIPANGEQEESKSPSPKFDSLPLSPQNSTSPSKAICACLLYSFCSVSMVLVNKSLASR